MSTQESTQRKAVRRANAELRREVRAAYFTLMSRHLKRRRAVTPSAAKAGTTSRKVALEELIYAWDEFASTGGAR